MDSLPSRPLRHALRFAVVLLACSTSFHPFASKAEEVTNARTAKATWHVDRPFWASATVYNESLLFIREKPDQRPAAGLLLTPEKVLNLQRADRVMAFEEGRDFVVDPQSRRVELPPGSRIPFLNADELYPEAGSPLGIKEKSGDPSKWIRFDNGHWFHDQQVEITYNTRESWDGYRPEFAEGLLPKTLAKLRRGDALKFGVTGDSITHGLNASGKVDAAPRMPAYPDLVANQLEVAYGVDVQVINQAVPGWKLEQGLRHLDDLLAQRPDLIIVAFGMNHFGARDASGFKQAQQAMLDRIRSFNPEIEVILVSPMHGNPAWSRTPEDQYVPHRDALASLVGPGIAMADLTTLWGQMLKRKRLHDLTGNGVNHPNDFGNRVYASAVLGLLQKPFDTERDLAFPMSPEETVKTATLPEGFRLAVFAAEPEVQNPIAIATDERGRLWVAENHTWAGASLGQFRTDLTDRILIFEDTNGDGRHDSRTVFWEGARKLTSIEIGFGGVWALTPPHLVFIPDANRDDVPDGPPITVLDGFDAQDVSHNVANGLRWGPDGWLYGRHGILVTSSIGVPGSTDSQRVKINTGVWRYHPQRRIVQDVLHGMTNSWGFDYDRHGEMFCINTVIGHLWHVIPGARTERMFGSDFNPHAYQLLSQVADHVHWDTGEAWSDVRKGMSDSTLAAGGGHAHIGLMIYQGDNWPAPYRDKLFTLNLHGRRINCDRLERQDSHHVAKHEPDFAIFADPFFRGMDLIFGPDGGVFIADWSDTGECHDHDGVHRSSGRIYKLTYGQPEPIPQFDLTKAPTETLVDHLWSNNAWWARQSLRILQERATTSKADSSGNDQGLTPSLRDRLILGLGGETRPEVRSRIAAALTLSGAPTTELMLDSVDENVRAWGIRTLADQVSLDSGRDASASAAALLKQAQNDESGLVALYVASALQKLPLQARWPIAEALARRSDLAPDRTFAIMLWLGIEPSITVSIDQAVSLAANSKIPLLTQNIARRLALLLDQTVEPADRLLARVLKGEVNHPDEVVIGFGYGLKGWRKAPSIPSWPQAVEFYSKSPSEEVLRNVRELGVVFGDGRAIDELLELASDPSSDPDSRRHALRAVLAGQPEGFVKTLHSMVNDRVLVSEAIRGLAIYDDPQTPKIILGAMRGYSPESRAAMVTTLASRPTYAKNLLEAVRSGAIQPSEVSAFHARQISSFQDPELDPLLAEVWGNVRVSDAEKLQRIAELRSTLSPQVLTAADLQKGRLVFNQVCSSCHVLFGEGKNVGPDLTGSNRKQIDYVLENVIDPSASVGADYKALLFVLDDGRVLSGVIRQQTDRTLTIQTPQELITLEKSQVRDTKPTGTSLMPEGLLQNLSQDQIRDLVAYLQAPHQVSLPD